MIKKSVGQHQTISHSGQLLGQYSTKSQSSKQLAQVETVKRIKNIKDKQGWHA